MMWTRVTFLLAALILNPMIAGAQVCTETSAPFSATVAMLGVSDELDYVALTYDSSFRLLDDGDLSAIGSVFSLTGIGTGTTPPSVLETGAKVVFQATASGRVHRIQTDPALQEDWGIDLRRGGCTGDAILANPVLHLRNPAGPAFDAAYSTDLLYVGTRYGCSTMTDNVVFALNAETGAIEWTFNGSLADDIDAIHGMVLDLSTDRLYVTTDRRDSTSQHSVWAIDIITGLKVWSANAGQVFAEPIFRDGRVYVTELYGNVMAFDAATGAQLWTLSNGGIPFPYDAVAPIGADDANRDLLLAVDYTGTVWAARDNGATGSWAWQTTLPSLPPGTTADAPIALAQAGTLAFVTGSAGALYEIDVTNGSLLDTHVVDAPTAELSAVSAYRPLGSFDDHLFVASGTGGAGNITRLCVFGVPPSVPAMGTSGLAVLATLLVGACGFATSRYRGPA